MPSKKHSTFHKIAVFFLWLAVIIALIVSVLFLIKLKSDNAKPPETAASSKIISLSEDPVVPLPENEPEITYSNLAATYQIPNRKLERVICYNSDGSLRNEYQYDEFGRLLYFSSHSSVSETLISYVEDFEVLSTYTNQKHFGDEYYDVNHNLIRFINIKNGYEYNYEYDNLGNMLSESYLTTQGATRLTEYSYNENGLVSEIKCKLNNLPNSITSNYYEGTRLVKQLYSLLGVDNAFHDYVSYFTYDSSDRLLSMEKFKIEADKSESLYEWERSKYDTFNRLVFLDKSADSPNRSYTEEYSYSPDGLTGRCDFSYNDLSTGEKEQLFKCGYTLYTWDLAGNITKSETHYLNNDVVVEEFVYTYDENHNVIAKKSFYNGEPASSYEYFYFE